MLKHHFHLAVMTHLNQLTEYIYAGNEFIEFFMTFDFELCQTIHFGAKVCAWIQDDVVNYARANDYVQKIEQWTCNAFIQCVFVENINDYVADPLLMLGLFSQKINQ